LHSRVSSSRITKHKSDLLLRAPLFTVDLFLGELGGVDGQVYLFAIFNLAALGLGLLFKTLSLV
jgi:hypothetical protein